MRIKFITCVFLAAVSAAACATADRNAASDHGAGHGAVPGSLVHKSTGGRISIHGMVIFGSGPYFIEHIPMLHPPHDFQIVATVVIKDNAGKNLAPDFSSEGYSFQPSSPFSLEDFMAGLVTEVKGSVHKGSFEQGGEIVPGYELVNLAVEKMNLIRQLPSTSEQSIFEVYDAKYTYQTNIITEKSEIQKIQNKTLHKNLWCVVGPDFFNPCSQ